MQKIVMTLLMMTLFINLGCGSGVEAPSGKVGGDREKASVIVAAILSDVGKNRMIQDNGSSAPIIIFEEDHASVKGQLQQALMLTRLHDQFKLNNIILESYSKGSIDDVVSQIRKLMSDKSGKFKEQSAATFLREGEISAAEFLKIVYPDVSIEKGESTREIAKRNLDEEINYDLQCKIVMALVALEEGTIPEAEQVKFGKTLQANSPVKTLKQFQAIIDSADSVIKQSAWTQSRDRVLFPKKEIMVSIEMEIQALNDIEERTKAFPPELLGLTGSLNRFKEFLKARSAASDDMVNVALRIARKPDTLVLAMIIGAGHTEKVSSLLREAYSPYAVAHAASMGMPGDVRLSSQAYESKMASQSVSLTLGRALKSAFPTRHTGPGRFKPVPILEQEWFSAKAELYSMVDELGHTLTPLGGGGGGPGKPPIIHTLLAGMPDDRFHGQFIYIDRDKISESEEGGRRNVSFPAVLNPKNTAQSKTVWIKVTLSEKNERPLAGSTSRAEAALQEALQELPSSSEEGNILKKSPGDKQPGKEPSKQPGKESIDLKAKLVGKNLKAEQIRVSRSVHMIIADSQPDMKRARFKF